MARGLADDFFDTTEDTIGDGAGITLTHKFHLNTQIERALNLIGYAFVKVTDAAVEFAIETCRVIKQDISQLALSHQKMQYAPQVVTQLLHWFGLVGPDSQPLDPQPQFPEYLFQQFLEKVLFVLEIKIKGSAGYPRSSDDVGNVRPMITLTCENSLGMPQYLLTPSLPFHV
jgi:hypothetical protein